MCILVMARSIFSKIQYTIHSSPLRAGYGGSIKNSKSVVFSTLVIKVVNVISCCTGPYHNRTRLYFHITLCIMRVCVCVNVPNLRYTGHCHCGWYTSESPGCSGHHKHQCRLGLWWYWHQHRAGWNLVKGNSDWLKKKCRTAWYICKSRIVYYWDFNAWCKPLQHIWWSINKLHR